MFDLRSARAHIVWETMVLRRSKRSVECSDSEEICQIMLRRITHQASCAFAINIRKSFFKKGNIQSCCIKTDMTTLN